MARVYFDAGIEDLYYDTETGRLVLPNGIYGDVIIVDGEMFVETASGSGGGGGSQPMAITFSFDGQGAAILVDSYARFRIPDGLAGTITKWTIGLDQAGSISIDIWKKTFAAYPPTNADSITGGSNPSVAAATKAEGTVSWAVSGGDWIEAHVESIATATRAWLILELNPD